MLFRSIFFSSFIRVLLSTHFNIFLFTIFFFLHLNSVRFSATSSSCNFCYVPVFFLFITVQITSPTFTTAIIVIYANTSHTCWKRYRFRIELYCSSFSCVYCMTTTTALMLMMMTIMLLTESPFLFIHVSFLQYLLFCFSFLFVFCVCVCALIMIIFVIFWLNGVLINCYLPVQQLKCICSGILQLENIFLEWDLFFGFFFLCGWWWIFYRINAVHSLLLFNKVITFEPESYAVSIKLSNSFSFIIYYLLFIHVYFISTK